MGIRNLESLLKNPAVDPQSSIERLRRQWPRNCRFCRNPSWARSGTLRSHGPNRLRSRLPKFTHSLLCRSAYSALSRDPRKPRGDHPLPVAHCSIHLFLYSRSPRMAFATGCIQKHRMTLDRPRLGRPDYSPQFERTSPCRPTFQLVEPVKELASKTGARRPHLALAWVMCTRPDLI